MATASDGRSNELGAIVREIRDRVRAQYPEGQVAGLEVPLPDLMPLLHARDAAEAKVASIGSVNPRPPGPINALIQSIKRQIARALGWFVRDQVDFNRTTVNAIDSTLEALNEVNRSLATIGSALDELRSDSETLRSEAVELKDIRVHWLQWRESWEKQIHYNEAHFLRSVARVELPHSSTSRCSRTQTSAKVSDSSTMSIWGYCRKGDQRNSTAALGRYGAHPDGV